MKARILFIEPVLGTLAGDPEIAKEFILSKHPEGISDDEVKALTSDEALAKACTVFPRINGQPFIWDYQWKGLFKEAFLAFTMSDRYTQDSLKKVRLTKYLLKRTVDLMIFIKPRRAILDLGGGAVAWCERPLKGDTARGERISLSRSEELPEGTTCEIEISTMNQNLWPYIRDALDYGELKGMLQWRNSGKGRFVWSGEEIA